MRVEGLQEGVREQVEVEILGGVMGGVRVEVGMKPRAQCMAARPWLQGNTASSSGCCADSHSWWDSAQVHCHLPLGAQTKGHHSTQTHRLLLLPAASWQRCLRRNLQLQQRRP